MEFKSSEYSIRIKEDGRIDISTRLIDKHLTEGVTLHLEEVEAFIERLRDVANEQRERRELV